MRIRSYAWSGRRGSSAHELSIGDREETRNRDCLSRNGGQRISVPYDDRRDLWLSSTPAKLAPF
jgi:hypothetical protein